MSSVPKYCNINSHHRLDHKNNKTNINFTIIIHLLHLPSEFVSFDPLFDSKESSRELPWTVDKSSIVEPRLLPAVPILEVVTPVRLKLKKNS
jgi:hypothetical protein